ncbi:general secretion pathway protein GspK [Rhodoplanes roseus]|uniref:T2SS protein K first SAM-like domain-containing protein n=1 Tax=Rhodoplanes roseus TaxID=29409 RepID=A0A327L0V4_9BRAD|nr:type II secretion system protein GspK [Rhodoplanes roseus]RAI43575.1 hypothetical protein CH341_13560 [Rhodoplanes roseus]
MSPACLSAPTRRKGERGFILVAVLWILAALATLVSIYAVHVSTTALAASARDDAVLARGLVTAGVELAAYRIAASPKQARPTRGEIAFRMGRARVLATFLNEAARIDLNAASRELLAGLFTTLGAQAADADRYADRVVAWRSPSSTVSAIDGEAGLYRQAGLDYGPRGGAFVHADELWLVAELPPGLVERALPYVTVFNGRPEIHARDAGPVVLAALPGAPAEAPLARGATPDREVARPGTTFEGSDAVRVTVRVDFDNGRTQAAEAVVLVRDFGDEPYRVLSWREDLDIPTPAAGPRREAPR